MGGDHRHGQVGNVVGNELDEFEPFAVGEPHVGEAEVVTAGLNLFDRALYRGGPFDVEAHAQQCEFDEFEDVLLVVNNEYRPGGGSRCLVLAFHVDAPLQMRLNCAPTGPST